MRPVVVEGCSIGSKEAECIDVRAGYSAAFDCGIDGGLGYAEGEVGLVFGGGGWWCGMKMGVVLHGPFVETVAVKDWFVGLCCGEDGVVPLVRCCGFGLELDVGGGGGGEVSVVKEGWAVQHAVQ